MVPTYASDSSTFFSEAEIRSSAGSAASYSMATGSKSCDGSASSTRRIAPPFSARPRSDRPPEAPRHTPWLPAVSRVMAAHQVTHRDGPSGRETYSIPLLGKATYVRWDDPSWSDLSIPHAAASGHRRHAGPAAFPHHGRDLQLRTAGLGVVGVEEQVVHAVVEEDGLVT